MLYTDKTRKAMKIAFEAHRGQVDKAGIDYVNHPLHLAEQMETEVEVCTALLHDVIEDTDWTFERLISEGVPEEAVEAIRLLTHDEGMPYLEYVASLKVNPVAVKVKLADLEHNSDLTRIPDITQRDLDRREKYRRAIQVLVSES